jgi:hypothetical protein
MGGGLLCFSYFHYLEVFPIKGTRTRPYNWLKLIHVRYTVPKKADFRMSAGSAYESKSRSK